VNELQLERLTNLVTNPYTWIGIAAIFSLIFILPYIRRFYPKSWQEAMAKEEACSLEHHHKPEMKLVRKIINIGFLSMLLISYVLSFHLLTDLVNPLRTFTYIFFGGAMLIILVSVYYENKIKKRDREEGDKPL